jgi:hypothetical protein
MDWNLVIEINRTLLLRFVAALFETIGDGETIARHAYRDALAKVLRIEASARRLITIAARGLVVEPRAKRAGPSGAIPKGSGGRVPAFPLFDPRRHAGPSRERTIPGFGPNVRGFDGTGIAPPPPVTLSRDDPVSIARLRRRIEAALAALEDIPGQARRLARRYAAQERPIRPMRPGRPPGYNARGKTPLDLLLADCHELALMALAEVPP